MSSRGAWIGVAAAGVLALGSCTSRGDPADGGPAASASLPERPSDRPAPSEPVPEELADLECFRRPVTLAGTEGADRLLGTRGRDVIVALGGEDVVAGIKRNDRVCAGGGNDVVRAMAEESWVYVDLGVGDDRFSGQAFAVLGGAGADWIRVAQTATVAPGPGRDAVRAQRVEDRLNASCLSYGDAARRIVADLARGWVKGEGLDRVRGVQCIEGSRFGDSISGSARDDILGACVPGDMELDRERDRIDARAGDDEVSACDGGDLVHLGAGDDTGAGGYGDDHIFGGEGEDHVWGIYGGDHLVGGPGDDRVNGTFYCDTGSSAGTGMGDDSPNRVFGGPGDDEVTGDLAADLLDGGPGFDRGYGGPTGREGDDTILSVERRTYCP